MINYNNFNVLDKFSENTLNDIQNILNTYQSEIHESTVLEAMKDVTLLFDLCKECQCIITIEIKANEIRNVLNSNNPHNELFELFLKNNNEYLMNVINDSRRFDFLKNKLAHYNDAVIAFENKAYYSACAALFTIADYLLSTITNNPTTGTSKRYTPLEEHLKNNEYFGLFVCTAFMTLNTFFQNTDFSKDPEPDILNRHWLLHGRYSRDITQYDCIKLFCLIHTLLKAGTFYDTFESANSNS